MAIAESSDAKDIPISTINQSSTSTADEDKEGLLKRGGNLLLLDLSTLMNLVLLKRSNLLLNFTLLLLRTMKSNKTLLMRVNL